MLDFLHFEGSFDGDFGPIASNDDCRVSMWARLRRWVCGVALCPLTIYLGEMALTDRLVVGVVGGVGVGVSIGAVYSYDSSK